MNSQKFHYLSDRSRWLQIINELSKKKLVRGLPEISYQKESVCDSYGKGKQTNAAFKTKYYPSSSRILDLLHMDLFVLISPVSLSENKYSLVVIDDYSISYLIKQIVSLIYKNYIVCMWVYYNYLIYHIIFYYILNSP